MDVKFLGNNCTISILEHHSRIPNRRKAPLIHDFFKSEEIESDGRVGRRMGLALSRAVAIRIKVISDDVFGPSKTFRWN
jgi:hypothetical protein